MNLYGSFLLKVQQPQNSSFSVPIILTCKCQGKIFLNATFHSFFVLVFIINHKQGLLNYFTMLDVVIHL